MMFPSNGPRRINWRAVNTMQNQPLDPNLVKKMNATVSAKYVDTGGLAMQTRSAVAAGGSLPDVIDLQQLVDGPPEVFILEIEKDFKYGKGKSMVAFADGGKNKLGNDVKYVKWYNLYGDSDPAIPVAKRKTKLDINEKTYTYGVDKAREFWNEKIKEGYNRVT